MPITDRDGRTARQAVARLLSRRVHDSAVAGALGVSLSTFSRRKDKPDFPSFGELRQIADSFGVEETILLVDFGYVEVSSLNEELRERYAAYRNALGVIESLRTRRHSVRDGEPRGQPASMSAGRTNSDA